MNIIRELQTHSHCDLKMVFVTTKIIVHVEASTTVTFSKVQSNLASNVNNIVFIYFFKRLVSMTREFRIYLKVNNIYLQKIKSKKPLSAFYISTNVDFDITRQRWQLFPVILLQGHLNRLVVRGKDINYVLQDNIYRCTV